jgi:hypothetical protein
MPKKTKQFNCMKIKPVGPAMVLTLSLFFSVFLTFAYPPSIAYTQNTHQIFFPLVFKTIDVTLAWDPNSEPDLAGYKLYIGTSSGNYTQTRNLGLTNQYTISDLIGGPPYFFSLTAYNQIGFESGFSGEVSYP